MDESCSPLWHVNSPPAPRTASAGNSAQTVYGADQHVLRQALVDPEVLADFGRRLKQNPVLRGVIAKRQALSQ